MEHEKISGSTLREQFTKKTLKYSKLYGLQDWGLLLSQVPADDTSVDVDYKYLRATVRLPESLSSDEIDHIANHEMAHVFLGEVSEFVGRALSNLDPISENIFLQEWEKVTERTAERLARLMERQSKEA